MVSEVTASQTIWIPTALTPNVPLQVDGAKTAVQNGPVSTPGTISRESQPGNRKAPASDPQTQGSGHQSKLEPEQQGGGPRTQGSNLNRQTSSVKDANLALQTSIAADAERTTQTWSESDPERTSPNQVSHIESALAFGPESQPTIAPDMESAVLQSSIQLQSQRTLVGQSPIESAARQQSSSFQASPRSGAPSHPKVYISVADGSMIVDASGISGEASKGAIDENSKTAPRVTTPGQGFSVEGGVRVVHSFGPETIPAASIDGERVGAVPEGVSIYSNTATAPTIISATAFSLDSSHSVHLEGTPYQPPTSGPTPITATVDGVATVPLHNGVVIHGTTMTAAMNVLGTPNFFSVSNNLIPGDGVNNIHESPAFTATGPSNSVNGRPTKSETTRAIAAATTAMQVDPTLSRGGPAVTVNGVPVSLDSAGELMIGPETMAFAGSDGSLGNLIAGGLQTGGPPADSASTTPEVNSTAGPNSRPSDGHTFKSIAESARSDLRWIIFVTFVAMLTAWLHT